MAFKGIPNQDPDAEETTLWDVTQEETRQTMKNHFLAGLSQEPNKSVRNKVCDTIAEMARASTLKNRMSLFFFFFWVSALLLIQGKGKREKAVIRCC